MYTSKVLLLDAAKIDCPGSSGDRSTVERSLADPKVFIELYDRYAPGIHQYAFLRVGEDLVDEVVVRTFLKAFRRRRSFVSRPLSFRAWLYGIEGRVISSYARAEADRCRAVDQELRVSGLCNLRRKERDAFLLMAWGRLPLSEAAQALGVSTERMEMRLDRALQRITCRTQASTQ